MHLTLVIALFQSISVVKILYLKQPLDLKCFSLK